MKSFHIPMDESSATSLGNLVQYFTTFKMKIFHLV